MQKLEKMKLICLQYAAAAQWLITYSIDTPKSDSPDVDKYKKLKLRTPSQTLKVASENSTVVESILYVQTTSHLEQSPFPLPILSLGAYVCVRDVFVDIHDLQEIWKGIFCWASESRSNIEQQFPCRTIRDSSCAVASWRGKGLRCCSLKVGQVKILHHLARILCVYVLCCACWSCEDCLQFVCIFFTHIQPFGYCTI